MTEPLPLLMPQVFWNISATYVRMVFYADTFDAYKAMSDFVLSCERQNVHVWPASNPMLLAI